MIIKQFKKLFDLCTIEEKKKFFFLIILIFLVSFLEVLFALSLLPFISLLSNPDLLKTNVHINNIFNITKEIFGISNYINFIFFLGCVILIIIIFTIILRIWSKYNQIKFVYSQETSISIRLVELYLNRPYYWFLDQNSSKIAKNLLSEVGQVVHRVFDPIITFVSQLIFFLFFIILIIIVNPFITIVSVLILTSSYFLFFFFAKRKLSKLGLELPKVNEKRFTIISNMFGSIKEIKIGMLNNFFIQSFLRPSKIYEKNISYAQLIELLPRYFIEAITFSAIIIIILILIFRDIYFAEIAPILALYIFVGYRTLPSIQAIYSAFVTLRFSESIIDSLYKDLLPSNKNFYSKNKYSKNGIFLENSIVLKNLNFKYRNSKKMILKNINITIPAFSRVGIVGSTGSGKSTLINIILGLLNPSQGQLNVDSTIIDENNKSLWQKNLGFVPQQIYLSDSSIKSNIAFGKEVQNINYDAVLHAAKNADIHNYIINELPDQYDTIVGERGARLSGGQRQRIGIARALYNKPKVLILDEATNALDYITEASIINKISNLHNKTTLILITHRLEILKDFDIIFLLEKGELIAQGKYEDLKKLNLILKKS